MRVTGAALAAILLSGCGDAFTSDVDAVAWAEGYELPVEPAAQIIATGKGLPLRRDVVEGISTLWVDYTLFAHRLASGDSLLDSATVSAAMWAEIQQEIATRYHDRLVRGLVRLDSAQLDSVYHAGQLRLLRHVLFAVQPDASPDVRAIKQNVANDYRLQLARGAITWAGAVEASEDAATKEDQGRLGLVAHGETVEPFEDAAFALGPGEVSGVVETPRGYHLIYRPPLTDVREEFRTEVRQRLEDRFDDEFLAALPERWDISVRGGIAPAVREIGNDPLRAKTSRKVVGTYRGGTFRVQDLARWLQAMPAQLRQQLPAASDSQIVGMVRSLIRNEALLREARDSGVTVSPEFIDEMRDQLRRQMALMAALLGMPFDSLPAMRARPAEQRRTLIRAQVLEYLRQVSQNQKRLQTVPPFLADELRDEADWRLVPAGVERVLDRARRIRLALDTLPGPRPTPAEPASGAAPPPPADSGAP